VVRPETQGTSVHIMLSRAPVLQSMMIAAQMHCHHAILLHQGSAYYSHNQIRSLSSCFEWAEEALQVCSGILPLYHPLMSLRGVVKVCDPRHFPPKYYTDMNRIRMIIIFKKVV
jgi:hypothetical protein